MMSVLPLLIILTTGTWNVATAFYQFGFMNGGFERREQSSAFCKRDLSTLRQLITIFRYGDITPVTTFPNDIYHEYSWPNGFGQLTRRGVERSYEFGLWTRHCYDSFLHKHVSTKRVYARSTDYDRTLMSAQAHLAGVYPPVNSFQTGTQKWGETSAYRLGGYWQPIPVHTVPARYDRLLRGNLNCPRFDELTTQIDFAKSTKKLMARDRHFLEKLAHKSGIKSNDLVKIVSIVESAVLVEVENGRVPVEWLNSERDLDKLAYFRDLIVGLYFSNPELTKLVSGKLVQEIIDRLHDRASGKSQLEHILYASHSTAMEGLLASLGVLHSLGHREPPYGSAIIFELHEMQDHSYAVAAYYRNSSTHDPIPLTIPDCHVKQGGSRKSSYNDGDFFARISEEESEIRHGSKRNEASHRKEEKKKTKTISKPWVGYYSKEELDRTKRRMTWCKLKNFKKALAKKATHNHDMDCHPKHPQEHRKEAKSQQEPLEVKKKGYERDNKKKDNADSEESRERLTKPRFSPYHDLMPRKNERSTKSNEDKRIQARARKGNRKSSQEHKERHSAASSHHDDVRYRDHNRRTERSSEGKRIGGVHLDRKSDQRSERHYRHRYMPYHRRKESYENDESKKHSYRRKEPYRRRRYYRHRKESRDSDENKRRVRVKNERISGESMKKRHHRKNERHYSRREPRRRRYYHHRQYDPLRHHDYAPMSLHRSKNSFESHEKHSMDDKNEQLHVKKSEESFGGKNYYRYSHFEAPSYSKESESGAASWYRPDHHSSISSGLSDFSHQEKKKPQVPGCRREEGIIVKKEEQTTTLAAQPPPQPPKMN